MPIYVIVDKDKDPLDPNEINAGGTITVNDGDIFIIDPSANDDITFKAAGGGAKDFEVWVDSSNTNTLTVEIQKNLNAEIDVADNADLSGFTIDAAKAKSVDLTAGNNVSLNKYEGSEKGDDILDIGNDFTLANDLNTEGGNDSITIGDGASLQDIDTGKGNDSITIGDDLSAGDILTGDNKDTIVIGDDANVDKIDTGKDADSVTVGDGFTATTIDTDKGNDTISAGDDLTLTELISGDGNDDVAIGDNGTVTKVETGKGNDDLVIGDDFTGTDVLLGNGSDDVTIGSGATIDNLDGGTGGDSLATPSTIPGTSNFETVVCFAEGTLIRTRRGEVPIEDLRAGDKVVTHDHGQQPIRWIGRKTVPGDGPRAPVRIAKGALGNSREMWVSQQHRMLVQGWRPEVFFGTSQVLVPAVFLADGDEIAVVERREVTYFHLLFDRHEIVLANGCYSESYHPGEVGISSMEMASRDEIFALFPELRAGFDAYGPAARVSLKGFEGRLMAAA